MKKVFTSESMSKSMKEAESRLGECSERSVLRVIKTKAAVTCWQCGHKPTVIRERGRQSE
jgi:hypothetical protein